MKGLLVCSIAAFVSTVALAKEPNLDTEPQRLLAACGSLAIVADAIIRHDKEVADTTEDESSELAVLLSEPLPQTYNAIYTGLISAHALSKLNSTEHSSEQGQVLGLWCVQDAVAGLAKPSSPHSLKQETQVELVDLFERAIKSDIP